MHPWETFLASRLPKFELKSNSVEFQAFLNGPVFEDIIRWLDEGVEGARDDLERCEPADVRYNQGKIQAIRLMIDILSSGMLTYYNMQEGVYDGRTGDK